MPTVDPYATLADPVTASPRWEPVQDQPRLDCCCGGRRDAVLERERSIAGVSDGRR
jgi:hypothetical protein